MLKTEHLKRGFPSAATLRQRMDAIGKLNTLEFHGFR